MDHREARAMLLLTLIGLGSGLLVGLARRGSLERLAMTPIRLWWLGLGAWLLESVIFVSPLAPALDPVAGPLYALAMVLVAVVVVANWRVPGLALFGLGLFLNALVIGTNGGFMPVSEGALLAVGNTDYLDQLRAGGRFQKSVLMQPDTPFWPLGDVVVLPGVAKVYSVGDLVAAAGLFVLIVGRMGRGSLRSRPQVTGGGSRADALPTPVTRDL